MYEKMKQAIRGRTGPVGLSLVAAAVTAVAFAAVSVAQDGGSDKQDRAKSGERGGHAFQMRPSEEDREALEEFRQCMADEGVDLPKPPDPSEGEQGDRPTRPEPPSDAERAEMEEAQKACEDKLPEGARGIGPHPCGPPPGAGGEGATIPGPPPGTGSQQEGAAAPQGATS